MLDSFSELRTRDLEAVRAAWRMRGIAGQFEPSSSRTPFVINAARFSDAAFGFIRYDAGLDVAFDPIQDCILGYRLRGHCDLVADGKAVPYDSRRPGRVLKGDRTIRLHSRDGFQTLMLRLPKPTLVRKLSAYIGATVPGPGLVQPSAADPDATQRLLRLILAMTDEVEKTDRRDLPQLVAHATDELYAELFETLSETVLAQPSAAAPSTLQVGRVEQYLVAHFQQPLTLETLAEISGVSARSVIQYFVARYGCTPQAYVDRVRVQMAHTRLMACTDRKSVAQVAQQSGFPTLARFETAYQRSFGHPPHPGLAPKARRAARR